MYTTFSQTEIVTSTLKAIFSQPEVVMFTLYALIFALVYVTVVYTCCCLYLWFQGYHKSSIVVGLVFVVAAAISDFLIVMNTWLWSEL